MKYHEVVDQMPTGAAARRVYGEPYVTAQGVTVIPVARVREGRRTRRSDHAQDHAQDEAAQQALGFTGVPMGVFVVHGAQVSWVPAVDANRLALLGVLTGLLSAVIASLAVLRRPPWPQITITDCK